MTTWTKEPPKEPGWYWTRSVIEEQRWTGQTTPRHWYPGDWTLDGRARVEFWPIPIQPPPTEQEKSDA